MYVYRHGFWRASDEDVYSNAKNYIVDTSDGVFKVGTSRTWVNRERNEERIRFLLVEDVI